MGCPQIRKPASDACRLAAFQEGAPADREGEGGMRRRPAGVSAVRQSRHSSAVGNTAPEVSLTRVAVTTRFAILKRDRNVEASSERPPRTQVPKAPKNFFGGCEGPGGCGQKRRFLLPCNILSTTMKPILTKVKPCGNTLAAVSFCPASEFARHTGAIAGRLGAKFKACGALEVVT